MSDKEFDESSTPEYRQKCRDEFVEITKTDVALAMFYLGENKYDLKAALEKFDAEDHVLIRGFTVPCSQLRLDDFHDVKVMSWNLEGLSEDDFKKRIDLSIDTIRESGANIVLLQELVDENKTEILDQMHRDYDIYIPNNSFRYYCGILVRKHRNIKIIKDSFQLIKFNNTVMDRHMVVLSVKINDITVKFITAHLESTKSFAKKRKDQLMEAFDEMKRDTEFCVFAGDLNSRDRELVEIGGLPNDIIDVWESSGKRAEAKFTWDPRRNFNASQLCPGGFGQRFDRMYFFSNNNSDKMKPVHFGLDGLSKVENGIRFPSDHWAIVGHFNVQ